MKRILGMILGLALLTSPAFAQRGHNGGHRSDRPEHGRNDSRDHRDDHRGDHRDGRTLDRNHHERIDRRQGVRERRGHQEVFFGGFWFSCGYYGWPDWIFADDVYVEMVGPNIYEIYSYNNPTLQIQVFVED